MEGRNDNKSVISTTSTNTSKTNDSPLEIEMNINITPVNDRVGYITDHKSLDILIFAIMFIVFFFKGFELLSFFRYLFVRLLF